MAASTRSKKTGRNLPFSSKMADICLQIKCREQRDYPPWETLRLAFRGQVHMLNNGYPVSVSFIKTKYLDAYFTKGTSVIIHICKTDLIKLKCWDVIEKQKIKRYAARQRRYRLNKKVTKQRWVLQTVYLFLAIQGILKIIIMQASMCLLFSTCASSSYVYV